jgi:branched-chain amino acid transport system ATP-binding protein
MNDDVILKVRDLTVRFGPFTALEAVSAEFRRHRLTAIIGPNGAGKSTFFNVISGALAATEGKVAFEGRDITRLKAHEFARIGIAKSFQITSLFPQLSARENVRLAVQMRHSRFDLLSPRNRHAELLDRADEVLATVGLQAHSQRTAADLAHGQQRSLEVAMALASDPKLLLLDEPTAGMSPEETVGMMDLISRLARERTVILVEHKMRLVMGICERLLVLHHGKFLAEGTPAEIRDNEEVRRVYLGQPA